VVPGRLVLCATPIGNLADAPPRLATTLEEADVIFCEDTRRSRILLDRIGVRRPLRSYHAGNEDRQAKALGRMLAAGQTVALMTDAGMPSISDPGHSAVAAAREAEAVVSVLPGPSAVTAAVAVSGLPSDRFAFEGFLPAKGKDRSQRLVQLAPEPRTMVFFSSPHRLLEDLEELARHLGDRQVCVARELTKAYEEVTWGTLNEVVEHWRSRPAKGELTLVIAGAEPPPPDLAAALARVEAQVESGVPMTEAVRRAAAETGVSRRALYQAAIEQRDRTR
jgi:16S rRNA (cytidine1402-2'-O)-methyltransferase